jgi:hypothetical protein
VRQKVAERHPPQAVVNQRALGDAAVIRLVVLEPEVRHVVAERQQEMVVAVVPRAEQHARFGNQVAELGLNIGAEINRGGAVGGDIQLCRTRIAGWRQIHNAHELSGEHGRINKRGECSRRE